MEIAAPNFTCGQSDALNYPKAFNELALLRQILLSFYRSRP